MEKTGTSLKQTLSNSNPWSGEQCGRSDCVTCTQGAEEIPECTQRSVVYENICRKCNPGAGSSGELKEVNEEVPSLYVGETSRSIKERAAEHWQAFRSKREDSHIFKHHQIHHKGEGEPDFIMKVVGVHMTALSR